MRTIEIAEKHRDFVFPAIGIHPWYCEKVDEEAFAFIENRLDACRAIGEVGLDNWIDTNPQRQRQVFERLLEMASRHRKPVLVHTRGAWPDTFELVKKYDIERAAFHWFTGPRDVLKEIVDRGYLVSATPAAEYSKAHREALASAPLENLLLETDSPVKYRGVEAEPSHLIRTLTSVSKLLDQRPEEIGKQTTLNARRLLELPI